MFRKPLILATAGVIAAAGIAVPAAASASTTASCFTASGNAIVAYDIACGTDVVIPDTVDGAAITAIGDDAFADLAITSVEFPATLTTIGARAFDDTALTDVTIPASVTSIGAEAFAHAPVQHAYMASDAEIPTDAFGPQASHAQIAAVTDAASALALAETTETVRIFMIGDAQAVPATTSFLGDELFGVPLRSWVIDAASFSVVERSSTSQILAEERELTGRRADGTQLEGYALAQGGEIVDPADYWHRDDDVLPPAPTEFDGYITPEASTLGLIGFGSTLIDYVYFAPDADPCFITDGDVVTGYVPACGMDVVVDPVINGNDIHEIGPWAFNDIHITSVSLPAGLTTIERGAFFDTRLETVDIPASVTSIGSEAFAHAPLTDVQLHADVTIHEWAFGPTFSHEEAVVASETPEARAALLASGSVVRVWSKQHVVTDAETGERTYGVLSEGGPGELYAAWVVDPGLLTVHHVDAVTGEQVREDDVEWGEGLSDLLIGSLDGRDMSVFHHLRDVVTVVAEDVPGYITPDDVQVTLTSDTVVTLEYQPVAAAGGDDDGTPDAQPTSDSTGAPTADADADADANADAQATADAALAATGATDVTGPVVAGLLLLIAGVLLARMRARSRRA